MWYTQPMTDYAFEQSGRRPIVFVSAAATAMLLWVALSHGAPVIIWMMWSVVALALSYLIIANPKSGIRITEDSFTHWVENQVETIPLSMISHVEIQDWSDTTYVYIHLKNGRRDSVFSDCVPGIRKFEDILRERGIEVVIS